MNKKRFYETPEVELLTVKIERNFLESPTTERSTFDESATVTTADEDMWHWMN